MRSPLAKGGTPSKAAVGSGGGRAAPSGVVATPAKTVPARRGRSPKTPDVAEAVIPFLSTTPTPPPSAATKSPAKERAERNKVSSSEMASLGQTTARRTRRRAATISPRTRGSAIASILASPGEVHFANGAAGIANRFVSPSKRSSAEAALNRLARRPKTGTAVWERRRAKSLDSSLSSSADVFGGTPTKGPMRRRRKRKAASDASEKVREMSGTDELDKPPGSEDKIPYNWAGNWARRKAKGEGKTDMGGKGAKVGAAAAVSKTATSTSASAGGDFPAVTVDAYTPKGKHDERWYRNFQKWTASHNDGENAAALAGLSPLPKGWASKQRKQYRLLRQEKKCQMTKEKAALLDAAGFQWEGKSGRPKGCKKAAGSSAQSGRVEKSGSGRDAGKVRIDVSPSSRKSMRKSVDSPERKSPRKSPPTQFYHNLGSASEGEGNEGIDQPIPGTPKESPSKRKSSRKSPPTQFYHNLGTDGKVSSARKSLLPKLNSAQSPNTKGSDSGSKKGRPLSPSKRLSVNSESLASVGANSKSEGKAKRKKKRRFRGSGGNASLTALGPMQIGELKQSDPEDSSKKKGEGVLSHKELEAELKKVRKRPITKTEGEGAKKKKKKSAKNAKAKKAKEGEKSASVPSDAKASKAMASDGKEFAGKGDESTAAEKAGASPSAPPSATKAPASSTTDEEAVQEPVCVTKLLLSCLSEDSADKAPPPGATSAGAKELPTKSIEAAPPPVVEPVQKDAVGEENATLSSTKDVLAEQPAPPTLLSESERPSSWTCDVCNEATFEDYDEAVAHEKECAGPGSLSKKAEEATLERRDPDAAVDEHEEAVEERTDSWTCDVCREATFADYDEAAAHERECQGKKKRVRKPTGQGSNVDAGSQSDSQPTPSQIRAPVDETALAQFSPLSLTSPLQANNLMDSRYSLNGQGGPSPPSHIHGAHFHPVTAVVPNQTLNLVSNVNLNVSLPAGMQPASDSHMQMALAERQYQEKMAEFGRLELEAKMVTDRMREIEERIEGIDSNAIAADVKMGRQIEETVSRKRSYRETHHYESSEGEYSDEYRSPRKRRRRRKHASEEEIAMKRVKVRSRSSRRGDESTSRSSYNNEEIVLKSSSRRSEKADRRRAYDSSDEHAERVYRSPPGSRKKSKGKTTAQSRGGKSPSRLRKSSPRRRQKSSLEEAGEDEASQQKPAARRSAGPRAEVADEGSERHNDESNREPREETGPVKAPEELPAEDEDGKEEAGSTVPKEKRGNEGGPSQPVQARDPLYWLAGGENSSDDESWDFDGPMILPPPPIR